MEQNIKKILSFILIALFGTINNTYAQNINISALKEMAKKGDANSQYELGQCYDLAKGVKKNLKDAIKWYHKAADQGNADAQNRLGELYNTGKGVKRDANEALIWYKKAAQNGNINAQLQLGYWYEKGITVAQNEQEAFQWYLKAAKSGDKRAQWLIGVCYENGIGVNKSINDAIRWYAQSAEQDYYSAQNALQYLLNEYKFNSDKDLDKLYFSDWTIQELNNRLLTWEEYYNKNKKKEISYFDQEIIANKIKSEIENWQIKGEFETTENWAKRVNENTRKQKIESIKENILQQHEFERKEVLKEVQELAQKYEEYKSSILSTFYYKKILKATNDFSSFDFKLMPYDADHETFLIHSNKYGDILLPVPVSEAPSFKQNWNTIKSGIKPEFVPNGDEVVLTKLVFINKNKEFIYDSHTKANYAITDVKYNFAPIEIADINVANIQIDGISAIPEGVSSTIVGKTSSDILTAQNADIERVNISASEKSNVDISIPQNKTKNNTTTFAIIIANENYHSVSNVPYASKDGEVLEKYLIRAVGLPKDHVKIYKNASFGNMAAALKHIKNLSEAFGKDLNLIFYYSGHGMPNEKTRNPMIIPIDGDASIPETCYDLDKVITTLGALNANSVIIMLDACFSGTERGDGMLMAARGIRIKSNQTEPIGNMVILSASQGDETAYPFDAEQHGLFTYYLLKKLQENKGEVTLGELSDYITDLVKRQSVVSNGKLQTPTVSVSSSLRSTWRNIKFGK